LPSRTLKYLEENVIFAPRTTEEVPGYEIPYIYFDYLRTRDARPLKGVFYHNAMDVVAMAAILTHITAIFSNPFTELIKHGLDAVALAKLYEAIGHWDTAARLFEKSLEMNLDEPDFEHALQRLSFLQKRRGNLDTAVNLWELAANQGHIYAFVELAKYYEHKRRDYLEAMSWTEKAINLLGSLNLPQFFFEHWSNDLDHRLKRLAGKKQKVILRNNNEME
jgi:tetratricopeptide (TPR) repeat protein